MNIRLPNYTQYCRAFFSSSRNLRAVLNESTVDDVRARAKARISAIDTRHSSIPPSLVDSFNRRHDYLRISLTEKCNLRCFYCMPSDGVELSPKEHILDDDEIIRLATLFVMSGVKKIRLTGGEPTVRKNLSNIISRLHTLSQFGLQSIAMTSNGLALHRKLPELVDNGLTHLNLSLDTLDPHKFELMTRRMGHEAVMKSLDIALKSPKLSSVKLNVVVIKGLNDSELPEFIEMTRDSTLSVRFIEFMPFTGNKWDKSRMVPSSELLRQILCYYPNTTKISDEVNDTARSYKVPGYRGTFAFISSMSDHFCSSCNRLRITADGQIKVCLFDSKEVSLRDHMRGGASDEEILKIVREALGVKKEKHAGMDDIDVITNRPMILIGGPSKSRSTPIRPATLTCKGSASVSWKSTSSKGFLARSMSSMYNSHGNGELSHIDKLGRPSMVDVSEKEVSKRTAKARGRIHIPEIVYRLLDRGEFMSNDPDEQRSVTDGPTIWLQERWHKSRGKGDVLTVAQLAGIMASKRTAELIPLCHPLALSHVSVQLTLENHETSQNLQYSILCEATASCESKTGVEMEALTAVSVSLLTVWDMLKAVAGEEMTIRDIYVYSKTGGKSGDFNRAESNQCR